MHINLSLLGLLGKALRVLKITEMRCTAVSPGTVPLVNTARMRGGPVLIIKASVELVIGVKIFT